MKLSGILIKHYYHNNPKYWDKQTWANIADSDQMPHDELDQISLQKDIKNSVHNNLCFLIFDFKINTLSETIQTNKHFVNTKYPNLLGNRLQQ